MDIIDILDKKVKDTVEAKLRLEEELVNLNISLEKLSKDNNELRAKNDSYSEELKLALDELEQIIKDCLLYTSPSPRDKRQSRMPSSA